MKITIILDEDDLRIARSIISNQTHFVLNSECLEDAVITGVFKQIYVNTNVWDAVEKLNRKEGFDAKTEQHN